ncbi:MAG: 16S rRNA (adenine(1518)-N(6)/adenine(1519)-N(6))-dimethyltransferase RsmA [Anaerolineales bacterium]
MDNSLSSSKIDVLGLLKKYNFRPDKSLGQNFLIDPQYLSLVAESGNISQGDAVLEIGAGLGNLTRLLAERGKEVMAVEIDPDLIPILKEVTSSVQNVKIIQGDILKITIADLFLSEEYLVVANIPYFITSNLLRHITAGENRPQRMVLTMQKEVAERIIVKSGKLSLLALSIQVYGNPSIVSLVPAAAFYPVPKVDSAIVRVDCFPSPLVTEDQLDIFFKIAKAGFSQKRKKLRNSLSAGLNIDKEAIEGLLTETNIDGNRRAETLNINEWIALTGNYSRSYPPKN